MLGNEVERQDDIICFLLCHLLPFPHPSNMGQHKLLFQTFHLDTLILNCIIPSDFEDYGNTMILLDQRGNFKKSNDLEELYIKGNEVSW